MLIKATSQGKHSRVPGLPRNTNGVAKLLKKYVNLSRAALPCIYILRWPWER